MSEYEEEGRKGKIYNALLSRAFFRHRPMPSGFLLDQFSSMEDARENWCAHCKNAGTERCNTCF